MPIKSNRFKGNRRRPDPRPGRWNIVLGPRWPSLRSGCVETQYAVGVPRLESCPESPGSFVVEMKQDNEAEL